MKTKKKIAWSDYMTYVGVTAVFLVVTALKNGGMLNRSQQGLLVPICAYITMAISKLSFHKVFK